MFEWLKNFFSIKPTSPTYSLGAFENPPDARNIQLASFQAPVTLPVDYITDMPPVENQASKSDCVGQGITKLAELYFKNKGIIVDLSARDLYKQCKAIDGIPNMDGTFPNIGAKVMTKNGVASTTLVPDNNDLPITDFLGYAETPEILADRAKHKLGGYAFVANDFQSVCQAIFQNKAVTASVAVDSNWFIGKLMKALQVIGRHYIILHGFNTQKQSNYGQNSWGIGWIGYIAGVINPNIKPGHFEIAWADVKDSIMDIIVFADIPPELLQKVINTIKLDLWCMGIQTMEGYIAPCTQYPKGTRAWRNKNPGNLRFAHQVGCTGQDDKGFAIFPDYQTGYIALRTLLVNACTGKSTVYHPTMTLYDFYAVYAPSFDNNDPRNYANVVAKRIGVSPTVQISSLIS